MTSQRQQHHQTETLAALVDRLAAAGAIDDADAARRRIALGYPPWLVLQELSADRLIQELSFASGLTAIESDLAALNLDRPACEEAGLERLLEMRWLPLADGRVAIANPYRMAPDGNLAGRSVYLAPNRDIDLALEHAFPDRGVDLRNRRRLGRFLLDAGAVSEQSMVEALAEQRKNGGRLGEVLIANGLVEPDAMTTALAARLGISELGSNARPVPLIPRMMAHDLRAIALDNVPAGIHAVDARSAVTVAFADPSEQAISEIEAELGRRVIPQVTDDETLDALLASVYAGEDLAASVDSLYEQVPHLSALRTGLSRSQAMIAIGAGLILLFGLVFFAWPTAIGTIALGTLTYVFYTIYRLYSAWKGWRLGSTINPSVEELDALDGRDLPGYTILLPVFREKPRTMRALFDALSNLDYPKHKLNGLLLLEADDMQTQDAIREIEAATPGIRPRWLKLLPIPPSEPRTKPKAMIYGLHYATGELLTIFDAEDKPDPDQLKKAAWAFQRAGDDIACIQAKLSYYNSRQNLLTRWFTLEYAAWFDLFLPGLHAMGAPIPLGGTSNHFRLDILKQVFSWDPYNVTEDADLGLRFTRAGYKTQMLESTTYEEANSNFKNWLRQRSRWIKGYMQTFLVHTRSPVELYRQIGFINTLHFLATVGGLIYTVVISPLFWLLLVVWLGFQPGWIPELFPGPIYYMAMASLVFGNFFFVFLALIGAVGRGQDDLSPYTLIFPIYWLMMSMAAYMALYELIRKPHYWQKTEHGLHLDSEPDEGGGRIELPPPEEAEQVA